MDPSPGDASVAAPAARHWRGDRYEIHPSRRLLLRDGAAVDIGARAFDLLLALLESRDRVMNKAELMARVWPGLVVEENTLHAQVSLLRKRLGARAIATVAGRGYRFVDPVSEEGGEAPAVAAPAAVERPRLPSPTTRYIGQDSTLAEALRLLHGCVLLTLTGAGGSGKTRLALEMARVLGEQGSALRFADLSGLDGADGVLPAIASALGVAESAGTPLLDAVAAHLGSERGVLVVDNCEHVSAEVARVLRPALAPTRGVQVIATSQHPLQLPGEQLFPVPALSLPAARTVDAIAGSEAVRLFVDRARLVLPTFSLTPANADAVASVCVRLDAIPLAIELAAARAPLLSVERLVAGLDERFRLLVGGPRGPARQQTLLASVRWSYELLTPDEQATLRALSVFAGSWTLEAAAAVCGAADGYDALDRLTSLYRKSLVTVDRADPDRLRYGLLQTVRQFARDVCGPHELAEAQSRHVAFFVDCVDRLLPRIRPSLDAETIAVLGRERDNLSAALANCRGTANGASHALRLAGALWPYWLASAQLERGDAFTRDAILVAEDRDESGNGNGNGGASDREHARVHLGAGNLAFYRGRYDEALSQAERALVHARAAGDRVGVGFCLKLLAGAHHALGHTELALAHYAETLDSALEIGDRTLQASAHNNLAEVHRSLGHAVQAASAYRMAIGLARESGEHTTLAVALCNLARLLSATGRPGDAAAALLEAHDLALRLDLRWVGDDVIDIASGIAAASAQHAVAARLHGAAVARLGESGSRREPLDEAFLLPLIDRSRVALGDAAFDAAVAEGSAVPYADAMAEVLDCLRQRVSPTVAWLGAAGAATTAGAARRPA